MPRMNGSTAAGSAVGPEMRVIFDVDAASVDRQFAKLETLLSPAMLATFMAGPVVEHFQDKFNQFFEYQGTDKEAWRPLSQVTIMDREAQGFGAGPINERTGELRAFVTDSPGEIRVLGTLAVLTYPGKIPAGELGRKVKTAQQGGTFKGNAVPARPVIDADETDMLYLMSALAFYISAGVS